jgi:OOP family OmpA-OmpF porin
MSKRLMAGPLTLTFILGLAGIGLGGTKPSKTAATAKAINTSYHLQIEFPSGSAKLDPKYAADIGNVAHILEVYPYANCEIRGYTDNLGSANANLRISQARAESVRQFMITHYGIVPDRVTARGYGPADPVASNATESGRRQNRRIVAAIKGLPPGGQ